MKFTLSWLKDHLDTNATLDEIVVGLTKLGLEVEGVEDPAAKLQGFGIARVLTAAPHPQADKLQVLTVDAGDGNPLQVVCGAPNARTGMKSVFSPVGTYIPGKAITLGKQPAAAYATTDWHNFAASTGLTLLAYLITFALVIAIVNTVRSLVLR